MKIARFHYLTQDLPNYTHLEQVEFACKNGVKWIQLRIKNQPESVVIDIAREAKKICRAHQTTCIINDFVEVCLAVDADGVHLGKSDTDIRTARKLLGENKIIGGTSNNLEDIMHLVKNGVNYVGLGPFRFTTTKQNLSPVLGVEGYTTILQDLQQAAIYIPVIAIGGIGVGDVKTLMKTGIHGIAVSSAVHLTQNKNEAINQFKASLKV